jgi:hypothetical protein
LHSHHINSVCPMSIVQTTQIFIKFILHLLSPKFISPSLASFLGVFGWLSHSQLIRARALLSLNLIKSIPYYSQFTNPQPI